MYNSLKKQTSRCWIGPIIGKCVVPSLPFSSPPLGQSDVCDGDAVAEVLETLPVDDDASEGGVELEYL